MRIDVVTIFPEYLAPLGLSLPGKARESGLLDVHVHDLRDWTHDRHRTVDDTPYGGGAGMVMKPEPWGEALDAVAPATGATLVVPDTVGSAVHPGRRRRAGRPRAPGLRVRPLRGHRPAGDRRRGPRMEVREVSIGDYVLNGGEVAALAIIEAVARLLPGFMGNAESLSEESYADGLLEYPVYTKPASWRGHDVPDVLLSGDHARIAAWRHDAVRTAYRRTPSRPGPRLAGRRPRRPRGGDRAGRARRRRGGVHPAARVLGPGAAGQPRRAHPAPARELRRRAGMAGEWTTLVLRSGGRLVGAVRAHLVGDTWDIGRLMVAPDLQGRGIGRLLLDAIEHRRTGRGDRVRAVHRRGERAEHPDLQEGRLPPPRTRPGDPRCRASDEGRRSQSAAAA